MAKNNKSLFDKLTALFKSGPVVKRKIRSIDTNVAMPDPSSSATLLFKRSASPTYAAITANAYNLSERLMRYQDFNEMEYCLHGDTRIAIPGGYKTLSELSEECVKNPEHTFTVYSYDHNSGKIVPAIGKQARQTRVDEAYVVKFDNGQEIIGTSNHRLMKRDGTYCQIQDLVPDDAMMPFYRKVILNDLMNDQPWIYTMDQNSDSNGWASEHDLVQNFVKKPNNFNLTERKDITFGRILELSEKFSFSFKKICEAFDANSDVIEKVLKNAGYSNFEIFTRAYQPKRNSQAVYDTITFDKICSAFQQEQTVNELSEKIGTTTQTIAKKLKSRGYENFSSFSQSYNNLKVVSVEHYGTIPLYDLTVDGYKNFATDTVISHNTPEISSTLDIYADEICSQDEKGRVLHIYSDNEKIKEILEDLFYNVLNTEFNLRSWARNLPVHKNTIIPLLDGTEITIENLSKKMKSDPGWVPWVYSIQDKTKRFVPGKVTWCDLTRKDSELIRVWLDDGSYVDCTPDHKFTMRDGSSKEAQELLENESLMPFYRKISDRSAGASLDGYEQIYDPATNRYVYTHRRVAEILKEGNLTLGRYSSTSTEQSTYMNHKVKKIERLTHTSDVYCMEVLGPQGEHDRHRFTILTNKIDDNGGIVANNSGICLENCKYGDFFLLNDVSPEHGVVSAFPIPVNEIEREENYDRTDPNSVRFRWVSLGNRTLENWEVSHFRLLGNDMFLPYGSSVIEAARRIWRQLILIEDAMLVYRVVRAPERRVFYVDVGNIPPAEIPMYVEEQRKNLRTNQVIDNTTGRVDLRYNPLSVDEDYIIPVRGGDSGTKIDTLAGGTNTAAVEDVEYIQKKLFSALKIPKAYLGYDESLSCVVPETKVDLLDGRSLTLEEIKSELEDNKSIWVYSVDVETQEIKPGKVIWCGPTRKEAELVRVTLDNGKTFDTTPDHKWLLRDSTWCQAEDLKPGVSLMPLYKREKSMNGGATYEQVYDPATGKWIWTHRLVVDRTIDFSGIHSSSLEEIKKVVHHKNFNRFDNTPDNLVVMGFDAHRKLHADLLNETRKKALLDGKYSGLNNGYAAACRNKVADLWSMQKLVTWCQEQKPTSKKKIITNYGLPETQLDSLLADNGMTYGDFATLYVSGGYKLSRQGNKGTFSHSKHKKVNGIGKGSRGANFEVRECPHCKSLFESSVLNNKTFCSAECSYEWVKGRPKTDRKAPRVVLREGLLNHSVVSVERLEGKRDTWCMEVAGWSNFGLSDGSIISNSKATLAQEDIRFSRTINVIQKTILSELNKLAIIHLYSHGFDGEDLQNFVLRLSNPSTIAQQQKLELWRTKFELAGSAPDGFVNKNFIRKEIWGLNDAECNLIDELRLKDKMVDQTIENSTLEDSSEDEGGGAGFGGGEGDDLFGGGAVADEEGEEDVFGDEENEEEGDEENAGIEPPEEDEDVELLISSDVPFQKRKLDEDDEDEDYSSKVKKTKGRAIDPQQQLKKILYNRARLKKGGPLKTHMPDLNKMSSNQQSIKDPYDKQWFDSYLSNPFGESNNSKNYKLSDDIVSTLNKFENNRQKLLKENFNKQDDELFMFEEDED